MRESFLQTAETAARKILNYAAESPSAAAEGADRGGSERLGLQELDKLQRRCRRIPSAFTGLDTGFSAGCAPHSSLSYVLPLRTNRPGGIPLGDTLRLGKSWDQMRKEGENTASFLQIVLINTSGCAASMDSLLARRSLTGELPGYMAKSMGIHTSVRIHRELLRKGFTHAALEALLRRAYTPMKKPGAGLTLITGFACPSDLDALTEAAFPVDEEWGALRRDEIDQGYRECGLERDCRICEESVVCGKIRRFARERRQR